MVKKILNLAVQGLFWIFPIAIIAFIINWLFNKINDLANRLFSTVGFDIVEYEYLRTIIVILTLFIILVIIGFIARTRLAIIIENIIKKIPSYSTIKDLINIFNSAKVDKKVLVVAIHGFTNIGYNIGLMYSTKESIIKDHYTVTLSMSPIPNGGFMFEIHKDNILVIEQATFNDNLQYLLSMGVKSMNEILNVTNKAQLINFNKWLKDNE